MTVWIGTSWKMNKTRAEANAFADALLATRIAERAKAQLFVIPPFPYIADVAERLRGTSIMVGGQNMHWEDHGPWTGEVSPLMLLDCGATMVELGHSERRQYFGENDETVALKVRAALKHGLIALVCIGDTKSEYDAGKTSEVLERQVRIALSEAGRNLARRVLIAYEPVWSIGEGGIPADPCFANAQHKRIKEVTRASCGEELTVLYGGSVSQQNCEDLIAQPHIDGLFIGRAAWNAAGYARIVELTAVPVAT
jgi:triosephosphate isomerase